MIGMAIARDVVLMKTNSYMENFNIDKDINQIFKDHNYICGRMISGSKSVYRTKYPKNEVYFNGNIFTLEDGKIWWGDIDFTLDQSILQRISNSLQKDLYILYENDGRFENEILTKDVMKERAKHIILYEPHI